MTALTLVVLTVFLGCLALLVHPLLRFLKVSEVPAALLACAAGKSFRRRLLFVLRSRRESYREGIACLPPGPLLVALAWNATVRRLAFAWRNGPLVAMPREKTLAAGQQPVPSAARVARALEVHSGSVSVRGIGPGVAVSFPARVCNPQAGQVHAVTDRAYNSGTGVTVHEVADRMDEIARWANVERNWKDIR